MQDDDPELTAAEARAAYWRAVVAEAARRDLPLSFEQREAARWAEAGLAALQRLRGAREPVSASHWGMWER